MAALHAAGRGLRARRHRPGLDPDHAVAGPARRRRSTTMDERDHVRRRCTRSTGNPSAALLAGWLTGAARRRGRAGSTPPARASPAVGAALSAGNGDGCAIDRPDGAWPRCPRTGSPTAQLPLTRRELGDLLAEELRRLDADQPYADALSAVTGAKGLDERPADADAHLAGPGPSGPLRPRRRSRPPTPAKKSATKPAPKPAGQVRRPSPPPRPRRRPPRKSAAKSATAKRTGSKAPAREGRDREDEVRLMSTPTVLVHRDPAELSRGGGGPADHPAGRRAVRPGRGVAGADRRGDRPRDPGGGRRARPPAARSTGGAWTSGGATSGSCRPATRSATRPRPARRCSTHVPVDPERVHPMPASDGPDGDDPEAAAARLRRRAGRGRAARGPRPRCRRSTCCCSASGPDGHVASLFPEHPALYDDAPVVAVRGAPKPPPTRLSLSSRVSTRPARSGSSPPARRRPGRSRLALGGAGRPVPAAGAQGRDRTLWLLDRAAAGRLPAMLARIASP